jgi:glycosyltransferase involved in cell wall biosynthesis
MIEGKDPGDAHGGVVTPLVNPNATAQAISKILFTPGLRDDLGQALKTRVIQSYDHPSIINHYRNVYSELTHLPSGSAAPMMVHVPDHALP